MKKLLLFSLTALISFYSFAQKVIVPEEISKNFNSKYPNSKAIWDKKDSVYTASFKFEKNQTYAKFNEDGKWIETSTPISTNELPSKANEFLNKNFFNDPSNISFKVKEVDLLEDASGMNYYVVLKEINIDGLIQIKFKTNGEIISATDQNGINFTTYESKSKVVKPQATQSSSKEQTVVASSNDNNNTNVATTSPTADKDIEDYSKVKPEDLLLGPKKISSKNIPYPVLFYLDSIYQMGHYSIKQPYIMRNSNADVVHYIEINEKGNAKPKNEFFTMNGYHIANPDSLPTLKDSLIYKKSPKSLAEVNAKKEEMKKREREEKERIEKEKAEARQKEKEEKAQLEKEKDEAKKREKEEKERQERAKYKTVDNSTPDDILTSIKESEVPAKAITALKKKYKNPEYIKWYSHENNFVGMFKNAKASQYDTLKAEYNAEGVWVKTITEMSQDEMPDMVMGYVEANSNKKYSFIRHRRVLTATKDDFFQIKWAKKEDQYNTTIGEFILDKMGKPYKKKGEKKAAGATKPGAKNDSLPKTKSPAKKAPAKK